MSLHRTLAHSTALQIAGKAISTILGFVAVILMTRSLGTEQFGWYITATGYLQFIGILIDFGFTVTTSNMLSEPEFDKSKLINTIFTWRFITAFVFQGLAPLVFLAFPYPTPIKVAVGLLSISFFASALQQVCLGYYRERLKMLVPTVAEVISRLLLVVGIAATIYLQSGFMAIIGAVVVANVLSTLILWFKMPTMRWQLDHSISRALFTKMWPTALSIIFNAMYLQGDRVILPLFAPQSEVGLYGAAYRVVDIVIQVSALVMGMIMPLITYAWSRGDRAEFKRRTELGFNLLALLVLPMLAGIFVLAEPIMLFTGGADFAGAGIMLKYLSICIFGICFGMVFGHVILAINRQKEALWVYASDAILCVIGYFVLIPRFGWWGAVMVTIFSEFYAGFWHTVLTLYYSHTRFSVSTFAKIAFASLGMGYIVHLLSAQNLLISISAGILSYALLILVLRVISWSQIKTLFAKNVPNLL